MSFEAMIEVPARRGERRDRRLLWLAIGATILLAAALRFWAIGSRALWLDEAYSAWFSDLGWAGLWFDSPRYETHPPLYYSLLKLWREVGGDHAGALRALSALAGVATVPVIALAAAAVAKGSRSGRAFLVVAVAALLAAASPRLVVIAQDARPYALMLLAYAGAILAWLRLTSGFRSAAPDGRAVDWALLGVSTLLTLWFHYIGLLFAGALLGALLLTASEAATPARWRRLAITTLATALFYVPCVLMLLARSGDWSSGWVAWDPLRFPGALLDLYGLHQQREVVTPVVARILFAGLIALGLRALWRRGDKKLAGGLALLALFPPLAAALLSQLGQPVFVPRTLVAVLAPAYLLVAVGLASLDARKLGLAAAALALTVAANLAQTLARPSLEPWDEIADTLRKEMRPGDRVWVYPNDTLLPLVQALGSPAALQPVPAPFPALQAEGDRRAGSPAVVAIDAGQAQRWAKAQPAPPGGVVWLLIRNPGLFDPDGEVERALSQSRNAGPVRRWRDLRLRRLAP